MSSLSHGKFLLTLFVAGLAFPLGLFAVVYLLNKIKNNKTK
ncbi:MAG: hypothetical protein PHV17_04755 [Candidatus Omnitrophica bacterium]|nr:hypothetical protein [Candidatus Omnitrophota bacterium]